MCVIINMCVCFIFLFNKKEVKSDDILKIYYLFNVWTCEDYL